MPDRDNAHDLPPVRLDRRAMLASLPLATVGAMATAPGLAEAATPRKAKSDGTLTTPQDAIVETRYGKVRGYLDNGIYTFKGIPYGASTEGKARFLPPAPPAPWTGVRNAMVFGPCCPQTDYKGIEQAGPSFLAMSQFDYPHEDCLKLNIWSPRVNDGGKRPVMVWLHGGAFLVGSANNARTHGANLARRGDVVAVSLNHRLNVFGHLDLSAFGEEYRDSGNAGVLDIVAALQWVRDNIAAFGGDPDCVTIFGNSGGGAKVATLLATPPAKGLFHRAIIQSTSAKINEAEKSERLSRRLLSHLGIDKSSLSRLFDLPAQALVQAGADVSAAPLNPGDDWRPKIDGRIVLQSPFEPAAPALTSDIPVIIGGDRHEFAPVPDLGPIPEKMLMDNLSSRFGADKATALRAALEKEYPGLSTNEALALINVQPYRANHLKSAERLAERGGAPIYYYIFAWQSRNLDGLPLAYHGSEVPFVFDNMAECAPLTGNSAEAHAVSAQISDAWISFARTGNPNHPGLSRWSPFRPQQRNTMIFNVRSAEVDRPWERETEAIHTIVGGAFDKPNTSQLMRS